MEGPRILCSCGRSLADIEDAFRAMRAEKIQAAIKADGRNIKPSNLSVVGDLQITLDEELNQLGITLSCCRRVLLAQVMPSDLY